MTFIRRTSLSWVEDEKISLRGHKIESLIGDRTYGEVLFLLLRGELPTTEQAKLLEAIIVSVIDHGVKSPSTIAAVTVANTGASLNASVAAGILAINKFHGGAIEDAMRVISEAVALQASAGVDPTRAAEKVVVDHKRRRERVSGYGHRHHSVDPRCTRLFELAAELGNSGKFIEQARVLEAVLSKNSGKRLPINADGAIAACLLEMDFSPKIANGIFMIARIAGLVAHAVEEQENHPPMRTVDVNNYEYE
jgi:citrate synthase